jgi:hypothetical protein
MTRTGLELMHGWLDQLAGEGTGEVPAELLEGAATTEPVHPPVEVEPRTFASRFEWGRYIDEKLAPLPPGPLQSDPGLWAWLTLFYFDQVCPADGNGRRKVGARARYIPTGSDFRTYYRHLLEAPWRVVRAHRDDPGRALVVLAGALDKPGEAAEQLVARTDLVTSPTVMAVATKLYIDPATRRIKRGGGGSGRGSPRRLADVLLQFDRTFDIYQMPADQLLGLLPGEFARFRDPTG